MTMSEIKAPMIPEEKRVAYMDPRKLLPLTKGQELMTQFSSLGYNFLGAEVLIHATNNLERAIALGLAFKGTKDYIEVIKPVPTDGTLRAKLRDRVSMFAQSLIDTNDGKSHLAARIKHRTGEEMLALNGTNIESLGFRNRFNRMMGGMMLGAAGIEVISNYPTTAAKVAGATLAAVGVGEHLNNLNQDSIAAGSDALSAVQRGVAHTQPLPRE